MKLQKKGTHEKLTTGHSCSEAQGALVRKLLFLAAAATVLPFFFSAPPEAPHMLKPISSAKSRVSTKHITCPEFPLSISTKWSQKESVWTWTNQHPNSTHHEIAVDLINHRPMDYNKSLVFYGSSHLRELYFALIRLHRGVSVNETLEDEVMQVGSGSRDAPHWNQRLCDAKQSGTRLGMYGVDLVHCGPPGKRLVPELAPAQVAIGFKTVLHTPQAEDLFVEFLRESHLKSPSVVVVDVGIWGPRGNKTGGGCQTVMNPTDELEYYLDWIQTTFSSSKIIYVYDDKVYNAEPLFNSSYILTRLQATVQNSQHQVLLRKDLVERGMPPHMPCGHGCAGPVMHVMAHLLLDWLTEATSSGCIV